jgi:hypothetical protein
MDSLIDKMDIIRREIAAYAAPALTGEYSYFTQSLDGKLFSVIDVSEADGKHYADTGLVVQIEGNYIYYRA